MRTRSFRPSERGRKRDRPDVDTVIREARGAAKTYRERSLAIHGWICAKCGREFRPSDIHQLTVHHKDGNHNNNPTDGSNWENLCLDCHDDEHSRNLLADYLSGKD